MSCLQVEKVSCRYNGQNVLEQLSLTVADNEIVCLLGASGCGKTTLLKAVAGLLPLAEGSIRLGDTLLDGPGVTVSPERRHIGMIFQDYALFPHLTVADNVGFGLTKLDRRARQQQVDEALALVNLQGLGLHLHPQAFGHLGGTRAIGGGQKNGELFAALAPQHILAAQALLGPPHEVAQRIVPTLVAPGVVDLLEMVQVHHQDG